jgi:SAM-dependent methyltransferase
MIDDALREIGENLVCPVHGTRLRLPVGFLGRGVPWPDGTIACRENCNYIIRGGIPRLVNQRNYADAFGIQWERYQKTQLDSYTGQQISLRRLERCLGITIAELKGKKVLECGSGAGRFTEHLLPNAGCLVSMDISNAVEANFRNLGGTLPYLLLQGDINKSPLPRSFFDVVLCLGVVQHTPSPEQTLANLVDHLAPGGLLVIDHYTRLNQLSWVGEILTIKFPLREVLKRLPSHVGLRATNALTAFCDPIRKRTCMIPWLDRIAVRFFPTACYYRAYPELPPSIVYEWNELDTHDSLTDYYKHRRSASQLRRYLLDLGITASYCQCDGNGIELRGAKQNGSQR